MIKRTAKALLAVLVVATLVIPEPACAARMSNITATVYYTPVEPYYARMIDLTTFTTACRISRASGKANTA